MEIIPFDDRDGQIWFNGELIDCDLIDERKSINDFIEEFIDAVC